MKGLKRISLLLLILCVSGVAIAQKEGKEKKSKKKPKVEIPPGLTISTAWVARGEELLEGVYVDILVNDQVIMSDTTDTTGGFHFELKFDYKYLMSFHKPGFVNKKVEIDLTNMPDEDKKHGYDLGRFKMKMIPYTEGMNVEDYEVPVARYYFNDVNRLVQLDREYLKNRQELLAKVREQNEKVLASQATEDAELEEEYQLLLRDAQIEFEAKDYKLAKEIYLEALKLKPLEEFPRSQINIINGYLAQDLGMEEKYASLITQGDEAFEVKDYEGAELAYKSAIKIKTTEAYPREQLQKIDELRSNKAQKAAEKDEKQYTLANVQISKENEGYSNELAQKYPQGLTVENYKEGSKDVERRIIVEGDRGVEYKKITHSWGGVYYFKNNKPVNHFVWQKEAIQ